MHSVGLVRGYCEGPPEVCDVSYPLPSDAVNLIASVVPKPSDADKTSVDNFPYQRLLGALFYLSMNKSPKVAYAVGLFSRFGSKPTQTICH